MVSLSDACSRPPRPEKADGAFYSTDLDARKSSGFAGEISLQRIAAATPPRNSSASGPLGMAHEILDIDHTHYTLRYPIEDRSGQ